MIAVTLRYRPLWKRVVRFPVTYFQVYRQFFRMGAPLAFVVSFRLARLTLRRVHIEVVSIEP